MERPGEFAVVFHEDKDGSNINNMQNSGKQVIIFQNLLIIKMTKIDSKISFLGSKFV